MSEKLAIMNDQPIEFYGKVVDQHGQPVTGAKVRCGVMVEKVWMGGHFVDHYTATDTAGNFTFRGLRGAEIVIQPRKEGYEFRAEPGRNFYYSLLYPDGERFHPDPAAPEVFTMWKQQGAEPLINGDKFLGIKADGTSFTIDLLKGRKSEGRGADGDLVVRINQPPQITKGQKFDWSFSLEAIDGGLIEAGAAQYLNEAPTEGYKSQISQDLKAADHEWSDVVRKTFFVMSRNGNQFARVTAEIRANYQGAAVFSVHYLANPKQRSRNLEHDPLKEVPASASK